MTYTRIALRTFAFGVGLALYMLAGAWLAHYAATHPGCSPDAKNCL